MDTSWACCTPNAPSRFQMDPLLQQLAALPQIHPLNPGHSRGFWESLGKRKDAHAAQKPMGSVSPDPLVEVCPPHPHPSFIPLLFPATQHHRVRLATAVCQSRHNQAGLGPTEPCTGRSRFLPSSGCQWGEYYRVAHSAGPIPTETQSPCRTLVASGMSAQGLWCRYHPLPHAPPRCPCLYGPTPSS